MLSRTFPSLARTLVSPIAGSSKSRTNYGILRQTTQIGSLAQTQTQTPTYTRMYSTPPAESAPGAATMDEGERAIYEKLSAKFPGNRLEVQDVSGGCGSFYAIEISSPAFKGLSTIKQHKLVNACLKEDIKTIHGLQLKTIPEE